MARYASRVVPAAIVAAALFFGAAPAAFAGPTLIRVDVTTAGAQAAHGRAWDMAIAPDGRYVVFASLADNLAPGAPHGGVFVRDLQNHTTTLVSLTTTGATAAGAMGPVAISADGRYVTFATAFDIGLGECGLEQLYVRDTVANTTSLVPNSCGVADAVMTPDGRYLAMVVFDEMSTGRAMWVDRQAARTRTIATGQDSMIVGGISDDGQKVLWSGFVNVRLWDQQTNRNTPVSPGTLPENTKLGGSVAASLSGDGRFAMFTSDRTTLVPHDTNGARDVFVRDMLTGRISRASVSSREQQAAGGSFAIAISDHGRYRLFVSHAENLVSGDTNNPRWRDLFIRDAQTGTTRRIDVSATGEQADNDMLQAGMTANGRFVAFLTGADDLVAGDTNGATDVFLWGPQF